MPVEECKGDVVVTPIGHGKKAMFLANGCNSKAIFDVTMSDNQWTHKLHIDTAHASPACTTVSSKTTCKFICDANQTAVITFSDAWTQYDVNVQIIF